MQREILRESLKTNLRQLSLEEFAAEFITKTQAIEEFYKLCHGVNAGKTISLLFNPHRLSTDTEKDDLSIYKSLQDDKKIDGLARLYLYNMEHKVANSFYNTIQRGYQNVQFYFKRKYYGIYRVFEIERVWTQFILYETGC